MQHAIEHQSTHGHRRQHLQPAQRLIGAARGSAIRQATARYPYHPETAKTHQRPPPSQREAIQRVPLVWQFGGQD
jgi:hypothetical protein